MEMVLNNGFCEMTMVEGGGFWSTVIEGISNFLVNRIVWTKMRKICSITFMFQYIRQDHLR